MCSDYKELITQLIEEGDLWEQLGITRDDKNFNLVNFSMHLIEDIDDLDEKFNKLIDEEATVLNDTNYFSAFKNLNERWAVGGYGIVDANSIGKSKRNKKKRYKSTILKPGKKYFYRAKLVYGKEEIVPRGIRLQAIEVKDGNLGMYMDKNKILFNVFIPNIFPDFLPNYREITLIGE